MAVALYALGVWLLASVPLGLFIGAVCRLNHWSQDGGELLNGDALTHGETQTETARNASEFAAA